MYDRMIDSIIPMTAGLLLDICGTFLILKPFMFMTKSMSLGDYAVLDAEFEYYDRMIGNILYEDLMLRYLGQIDKIHYIE